jgi:hypothetical protein
VIVVIVLDAKKPTEVGLLSIGEDVEVTEGQDGEH